MTKNNISVIMVSYHTGDVLWHAIDSVLSQDGLKELVLVNNGNPDDVLKRLSSIKDSKFKLISGHGNIGFAAGCNLGVKNTGGEYILLLNPDSILCKDALVKSIFALHELPQTYVVGCKILNYDGTEQRGCRRNLLTVQTLLTEVLKLNKIPLLKKLSKPLNLNNSPAPEKTSYVEAISGAFMFMSKEIYKKIGGMDEGYFLHVEDLDFCLQVNRSGGKIVFTPSVEIKHELSTSNAPSSFVEMHKNKGFIRYFNKNFIGKYSPIIITLLSVLFYTRGAILQLAEKNKTK